MYTFSLLEWEWSKEHDAGWYVSSHCCEFLDRTCAMIGMLGKSYGSTIFFNHTIDMVRKQPWFSGPAWERIHPLLGGGV